jgi:hypothetical protein
MKRYVCQQDRRDLGPVVEGEPVPVCPDHPDGIVEIVEDQENGTLLNP